MPGHRRQPIRFVAAAAAAAMAIALAGCTSGSDAIPVPGADEEITAPVASFDDATAVTDTTQTDEIPTTASPEPVAAEPTPDSAAPTSAAPTPTTAPTTAPSAAPSTDDPTETGAGAEAAPDPEAAETPDDAVFLRLGDQGDEVGLMQFKLSVLQYLPTGSDTGVFDEATESGLRRFQSDYGLGVDGVFGPLTERSLNAALQSVNVES